MVQLGLMASSALGFCGFPYFAIPYGCWCGINVAPIPEIPDPVDDFDAACRDHDACYEDGAGSHLNLGAHSQTDVTHPLFEGFS